MSTENTNTAVAEEIPNLLDYSQCARVFKRSFGESKILQELAFVYLLKIQVPHVLNVVWHTVHLMKLLQQITNKIILISQHLLIHRRFHI